MLRTRLILLFVLLNVAITRADSVRTLDGKVIDGSVKLDAKGGLSVSPRNGQSLVHVDLNQILRVKLDNGESSVDTATPDPWLGTDIGINGQGGTNKLSSQQLTIEAGGQGLGGKSDSVRFVSQTITGNGEVSAHLMPGGQTRPGMITGAMFRDTTDAAAPMVALICKQGGAIALISRGSSGQEAAVINGPTEHLPIWLRLVRKDTAIIGLSSTDAKTWTRVGDVQFNRGADLLAGTIVASGDPANLASAVFERAHATADEPTGATVTPIGDLKSSVTKLKKQTKSSQINTVMINGQVIARDLLDGQSCEVRYAIDGKFNMLVGDTLMPDREKAGGSVLFQVFADNEKIFESTKITGDSPPSPMYLPLSGRKELRFVVIDSGNGKSFSSAEFRQIRLVTFSAVRQAARSQTSSIVTVSGSTYGGVEVRAMNKDSVQFSRGERRDLSIPADQVARIYLPGLTQQLIDKIPTGTGVMMTNGDFYEGDIDRFADGKVQVNSVIFGPREFSVRQDVLAVSLKPVATDVKPADYVVESPDRSVYMADALAADGTKLVITDHTLGKIAVEFRSIREINYGGDKLKWLAGMRPRRIDPAADRTVDGFLIDATIFNAELQLTGTDCDRGVSLSNGSSVTYDLDAQYKTLLCVIGVPVETMPNAAAVFIAEADGKEVFRSPARTSVQDALPVSIDASKAKTITLRVESEKGAVLPVTGLWGDPLLVKAAP